MVPLRCIEDGTWKRYTRIATQLVLGAYRLQAAEVVAGPNPTPGIVLAAKNLFPSIQHFSRGFDQALEPEHIHETLLHIMRVPMLYDTDFLDGPLPRLVLFMSIRADRSFAQPFTLHAITQSLSFILRLVFFRDCHQSATNDEPVDVLVVKRHPEIEQSKPHSFGYFRTCVLFHDNSRI